MRASWMHLWIHDAFAFCLRPRVLLKCGFHSQNTIICTFFSNCGVNHLHPRRKEQIICSIVIIRSSWIRDSTSGLWLILVVERQLAVVVEDVAEGSDERWIFFLELQSAPQLTEHKFSLIALFQLIERSWNNSAISGMSCPNYFSIFARGLLLHWDRLVLTVEAANKPRSHLAFFVFIRNVTFKNFSSKDLLKECSLSRRISFFSRRSSERGKFVSSLWINNKLLWMKRKTH